ncbi:GerW family sporulation protein [Peribacillus deserti]|uniref:Sporulation protein YtfJ n=1 Tax=Peribacillus deserti TaxID=673318 RepID=A0A2N5M0E1_9BACI|nr:sporulation protein YtfJ [Peribacillus deserti]
MSEHPLNGLMNSAMDSLKQMIDVNTIIGDPIETPDGSVIITVSRVGFGFAAGGSEFNIQGSSSGGKDQNSSQFPFGGGSGGGVSITPIAFLVVNSKGVQMLHLDQNAHLYEKLLDAAPAAFEKIQKLFSKGTGQEKDQDKKQQEKGQGEEQGQKQDQDQKQQEKGQGEEQGQKQDKGQGQGESKGQSGDEKDGSSDKKDDSSKIDFDI